MNTLNHAIGLYRKSKKIAVKVIFANGNSLKTEINGTLQDAKKYYLNKVFNIGQCDKDIMSRAIDVIELQA